MGQDSTVGQGRGFAAPARVNLIGEHTDYTGGLVMPMAIPFTTVASVSAAEAGYRFTSDMFDTVREMDAADRSGKVGDWSDYPVGVLREMQALGIEPPAFHLHLRGDVPLGSGLSSSASVEVATAMALLAHAGKALETEEIATLCRRAENVYVGSPCGIMDQFVVTAAREGMALLLHTASLKYELLPMTQGELANCRVVIANSEVKHSIVAGSSYGNRRAEVEAGQDAVRKQFPQVRDLGEATLEQVDACREAMSAESYRRCRHIVTENARVEAAGKAMRAGDAGALGKAMTESHASQRDDFECSCAEIDFLVETALTLPGCFGARLTGGGFGGCTVNLVEAAEVDGFQAALGAAYRKRYNVEAAMYVCSAVDGAVARAEDADREGR